MKTKATKENKQQAYELGIQAFNNGKKRMPYQDKNMMDMLIGFKVGEGADKLMGKWLLGWDKTNLSTEF